MPRKTKKQKILAEYRRKLSSVQTEQSIQMNKQSSAVESFVSFAPKKTSPVTASYKTIPAEILEAQKKFVIRDLRKTMLLSLVAISIVLVLYWVTKQ